ncbi:uncharacterized protein F5Z01DRAFT_632970 [Emericellopsis atlantica]|uniref:Uncharacterized protein n=1 Tax=Emericellopsis atlantica TaxID=2614577 RepID=A0A9P7ZTA6_9HYPO|nr:uncharacterized protein F5Z01DRAFT_632970 [Emericellopsis atlantica]KAG9257959.1 hypothetical protein F5Z01DRAFT_632970 [Emericellopsis atlantica]
MSSLSARTGSDHCNKRTLLQFPETGTKTIVLAEPSAARKIKSWRHFDPENVIAVTQWEDHHRSGQYPSIRIDVPSSTPGGDPGEVTIALVRGHHDVRNQHPAFGITYRPPPSRVRKLNQIGHIPPTTPDSNSKSSVPMNQQRLSPPIIRQVFPLPPTPPASPSLQSKLSTASLTPQYRDRTVSVIYASHGIEYSALEAFVRTHLVAEAALPLTALLHPFDDVRSPWWLSRSLNIKGMASGLETARTTCAKAWISTRDGERITKGIMHRGLHRRTHSVRDVRQALEQSHLSLETTMSAQKSTRALALEIGEDVALTSEGIWEEEPEYVLKNPLDILGGQGWSTSLRIEALKY